MISPEPANLVVKRWTRYGKDRLYVSTGDGRRVGWLDLLTGEPTVEMPEFAHAFREALQDYQSGHAVPSEMHLAPAPSDAAAGPDLPTPAAEYAVTIEWTDLALNRPGQGVRAEAESLLVEMKGRSRLKAFVARALDAKTDERAFRVGADGEEAVGARLDRLTKHGCRIIHSIPLRPGEHAPDIDHLVITKGGVYAVNTKHHPGGKVWVGEKAILVNGQRTDYLRKSRYEADRVRRALLAHLGVEVPVRPVLVFLTGTLIPQVTIKQMPDVLVLDRMDIPGAFKRAPERMSADMIERVYMVARRSTTWTASR